MPLFSHKVCLNFYATHGKFLGCSRGVVYCQKKKHNTPSLYMKPQCRLFKKGWASPGFKPGTSRTQSENHTPRPTGLLATQLNTQIITFFLLSPSLGNDFVTTDFEWWCTIWRTGESPWNVIQPQTTRSLLYPLLVSLFKTAFCSWWTKGWCFFLSRLHFNSNQKQLVQKKKKKENMETAFLSLFYQPCFSPVVRTVCFSFVLTCNFILLFQKQKDTFATGSWRNMLVKLMKMFRTKKRL